MANLLLPETGFLRISQILGNPKVVPPIPGIIPISRSSWWAGVSKGIYPKPVKLGARTTAWRVEDIRAWMESCGVDKSSLGKLNEPT